MQNNPDSGALNRDSIYIKFDPLVSGMSLKGSDAGTIVPDGAPDKRCLFIFSYSVINVTCTVPVEIWILLIPRKELNSFISNATLKLLSFLQLLKSYQQVMK